MVAAAAVVVALCISMHISSATEAILSADGAVVDCTNPQRFVRRDVTTAEVLEHSGNVTCRSRQFAGSLVTLGFITPWNAQGFQIASDYPHKFTHLAPCWLQLRDAEKGSGGGLMVAGTHDVNSSWMGHVRRYCGLPGGACPKIVPRVVFEQISWLDVGIATQALLQAVIEHGFDGLTLEIQLAAEAVQQFLPTLARALRGIKRPGAAATGAAGCELILVIPPVAEAAAAVTALEPFVSAFSVMTYDYSAGKHAIGPNSPLAWVTETMDALVKAVSDPRKLLVGLPWYGYDSQHPITGQHWIDILRASPDLNIKWDTKAKESFLKYKQKSGAPHTVYFPTPLSLAYRLDAAAFYGGVAIWELGQGLPWLYDLL